MFVNLTALHENTAQAEIRIGKGTCKRTNTQPGLSKIVAMTKAGLRGGPAG
jgi:hypothetical protein